MPARIEPLHGAQVTCVDELGATPARKRATWAAYVRALAGAVRTRAAGVEAGQAPPMAAPDSRIDLTKLTRDAAGRPAPAQELPAKSENGPVANSGARYRVQFTADRAYLDLLEEARQLLAHVVPDRDLVEVWPISSCAVVRTTSWQRSTTLGASGSGRCGGSVVWVRRPQRASRHREPTRAEPWAYPTLR